MNLLTHRATPLLIGLGLSIGALASAFTFGANDLEQSLFAARWTSRVGVPVFLCSYLASTLFRLKKNELTQALMRRRRQWGLAFAWTHSVHLAALTYYLFCAGKPPDVSAVFMGGLAYFMIYVLALTSNDGSMKTLGKNWKRLHTAGIHYIWFIYLLTYAGRLSDPRLRPIGIIGGGVFIAALLIRIVVKQRKRQSKKS